MTDAARSAAPGAASDPGAVPDWTRGERGLALQRCGTCAHLWYFRRDFCPACGAASPVDAAAAGTGVVEAATLVHRAPSDAFRALAPYLLVLVRLDEGVRVMGHGAPALAIGDRVRLGFRDAAGRPVPYFDPLQDA
jgi:uncharacterized OB-fold protein